MAHAEIRETLSVDRDKLFKAITQYEDYPKFVDGCKTVKVERKGPGRARVTYFVSMIKEVSYTLDHTENAEDGKVEWVLAGSEFLKENSGCWEIKSLGSGKTEAFYRLDIEFKFPVPGFVLSKLVKGNLPAMLRNFEQQAKRI